MLIDLHVHTTAYSGCARSDPHEMLERATEIGLDAIVITEHNVVWPEERIAALQKRYPAVKLFRGIEVTGQDSNDFLIYGVMDLGWFETGMPICRLVGEVHRRGGAITWAHPFRRQPGIPDGFLACPVDAMEMMSCNMLSYLDETPEGARREIGAWGIASSDAHHWTQLGCFASRFQHPPADEQELAAAIRSGAFSLHADESVLRDLDHPYGRTALRHIRRSVSLSLSVDS